MKNPTQLALDRVYAKGRSPMTETRIARFGVADKTSKWVFGAQICFGGGRRPGSRARTVPGGGARPARVAPASRRVVHSVPYTVAPSRISMT